MSDFETMRLAYLDHLRAKGQATFSPGAGLTLFRRYLEASHLDYRHLKLRQAQEFQSFAMSLTRDDGEVYYAKNTVSGLITSLRGFYAFLREKNLVYQNPFVAVKKVKQKKSLPVRIMDEEETGKLLSDLGRFWEEPDLMKKKDRYRLHVIAELLYATGMNIGEVMKMEVSALNLERGYVQVGQGRASSRRCLLNDYARGVLAEYLKMRPFMLAAPQYRAKQASLFGSGSELKKWVGGEFEKACQRQKIKPVRARDLRHALGLHLVKAGCDARFVQKILGHGCLGTTQLYVSLHKSDLRAVIDTFHPRLATGEAKAS